MRKIFITLFAALLLLPFTAFGNIAVAAETWRLKWAYTYPAGVPSMDAVFIKRHDGKYSVRFNGGGPENILELRKTPPAFDGVIHFAHGDVALINGVIEKNTVYGKWESLSGHRGILTGNITEVVN
jgi:hypothetical protein